MQLPTPKLLIAGAIKLGLYTLTLEQKARGLESDEAAKLAETFVLGAPFTYQDKQIGERLALIQQELRIAHDDWDALVPGRKI